jgi:hypothetical protein
MGKPSNSEAGESFREEIDSETTRWALSHESLGRNKGRKAPLKGTIQLLRGMREKEHRLSFKGARISG